MWKEDERKRDECTEVMCEDGDLCRSCRDGHADDLAEAKAEARHRED